MARPGRVGCPRFLSDPARLAPHHRYHPRAGIRLCDIFRSPGSSGGRTCSRSRRCSAHSAFAPPDGGLPGGDSAGRPQGEVPCGLAPFGAKLPRNLTRDSFVTPRCREIQAEPAGFGGHAQVARFPRCRSVQLGNTPSARPRWGGRSTGWPRRPSEVGLKTVEIPVVGSCASTEAELRPTVTAKATATVSLSVSVKTRGRWRWLAERQPGPASLGIALRDWSRLAGSRRAAHTKNLRALHPSKRILVHTLGNRVARHSHRDGRRLRRRQGFRIGVS